MTGYIMKKMVVKLQDFRTFVDGTVRDGGGNIIQFLYGGDGLDPKRMIYTKGIDFPFSFNAAMEANILNSKVDASSSINPSQTKRALSKEEIGLLVSYIQAGCPGVQSEVTERATYNLRVSFRVALADVSIYPSEIPKFCARIRDKFETCKVACGTLVGIGCASALGETGTQMSVHRDEQVIVMNMRDSYIGPIGEFIDRLFGGPGDQSKVSHDFGEYYIMTVEPKKEKMQWKRLTEISRHPANGHLMKVRTKSGRSVTTTLSHSHLKKTLNGIVPIRGDNLKIGDRIPVLKQLPLFGELKTQTHINEETSEMIRLDFNLGVLVGRYLTVNEAPINSLKLKEWLRVHFGDTLLGKRVASFVFESNKEFICGLLRGYFDQCGYVDVAKQRVLMKCSSKVLSQQIALLLCTLGIFSTFEDHNDDWYIISLLQCYTDMSIFLKEVGSSSSSNMHGDLHAVLEHMDPNFENSIDCIPCVGDLIETIINPLSDRPTPCISRQTLRDCVEIFKHHGMHMVSFDTAINSEVVWDEIVEIEILDGSKQMVYDFGVEGNHTFALQSGLLVHNTLNVFHNAGNSAKDVTLGVPRFKELLNTSKKPMTAGCTVFFNEDKSNLASLEAVQPKGYAMEGVYVQSLLDDKLPVELKYIADPNTKEIPAQSPLKLVTYKEYKEEWWTKLHNMLSGPPDIIPERWVILLHFDISKLHRYRLTLSAIAEKIQADSPGTFSCVPSPDNIGRMEVYLNFSEIKTYVASKIDLPSSDDNDPENGETSELITVDNVDFFTAREVALETIYNTCVQGIPNITKTYPKEDPQSKEWFIETQGTNLQDILMMPGIDTTRTISDNMWEIYRIFGIEAARTFLIRETTKIISFDGTYVNPRHFSILVDSMTRTGTLTSVNRDGIPRDVGPLAKGMFEKAVDNFAEASIFGEYDQIRGVAGAVMMGTSTDKAGTASVEVKDAERLPSYSMERKASSVQVQRNVGGVGMVRKGKIKDSVV